MTRTCFFYALFLILASNVYAQDNDAIEQYFEHRKAMIRKMLESFGHDMDMESLFDESDKKLLGMSGRSGAVVETQELSNGEVIVKIKPQDKNGKLDLKVTKENITITSENKSEVSGNAYFSKSSQVIPIPEGYYAKGPEQNGDDIVYRLIPGNMGGLKKSENPSPLPKSDKAPLFKKSDGQSL